MESGEAFVEFLDTGEAGIPGDALRALAAFDFFEKGQPTGKRDEEREWLFRTVILFMVQTAVRSFNIVWMCVLAQRLEELTKRRSDLSLAQGVVFSLHNDKKTQQKFKKQVLIIPHEAVFLCALWSLAVLMFIRDLKGIYPEINFATPAEAQQYKVRYYEACDYSATHWPNHPPFRLICTIPEPNRSGCA